MKITGAKSIRICGALLALIFVLSIVILPIGGSVYAINQELVKNAAVTIAIGPNPNSRNFSWRSFGEAKVQICKRSEIKNNIFPEDAKVFTGESLEVSSRESYNHVTVTGLKEGEEYAYRLGAYDGWDTNIYTFETYSTKDGYDFIFVGDPQITSQLDADKFANTIDMALVNFPKTALIISGGDTADLNQEELFEMALSPSAIPSVPFMATQGNHDDCSLWPLYFYMPNMSTYGETTNNDSGGDYYFTYGNALFMVLNINSAYRTTCLGNEDALSEHDEFITETMASIDKDWNFVVFHMSIYSAGNHSDNEESIGLRQPLAELLSKHNIDAVFAGHDHTQVRTYIMYNNEAVYADNIDYDAKIATDPQGALYITGTGSSNKHYAFETAYLDTIDTWAAFRYSGNATKIPCFTRVNINKGTFTLETYTVNGEQVDMIDNFTIVKTDIKGCGSTIYGYVALLAVVVIAATVVTIILIKNKSSKNDNK